MRIAELLASRRPLFSFEFFPPRTEKGARSLVRTIADLAALEPDFVSVTCPLDKERRPLTFDLVARIKRELGIEAMAHLVTVDYTRDEMRAVLEGLREDGIENVLALRGDMPEGVDPDAPREFPHGSDLAAYAADFGLCVGGAAHPERHPESTSWEQEMQHAVEKVKAGCEFLITQLFLENSHYFRYVERAREAGIRVPIVPGIMPVHSVSGILRMTEANRNEIPSELLAELNAAEGDEEAVRRIGIRHATAQCEDLLARGAPGIHFYTLNRSPATRQILTDLRRGE